MPHLHFKGKTFVQNHHLAVPFHELIPVKTKGLSKKPSLHDNLILQGDNLKALKALLPTYQGKVKCIYIDPPYNTGNEGWAYNDNVNSPMMQAWLGKEVDREDLTRHDKWCCMMLPRLKLLRELLSEDGAIFDDNEVHHLRCLMDEVFGEGNFVANVVWEKADSPKMDVEYFSDRHDHILVYAHNLEEFSVNREMYDEENLPKHYDKKDENGRPYYLKPLRAMGGQGETREARPGLYFGMEAPDGKRVYPKLKDGGDGAWRWSKEKVERERDRIEWVETGSGWTPYFRIFADESKGKPPETIFRHSEAGSSRTAMADLRNAFGEKIDFGTPKPLKLLSRILHIATDKDSIILDSFAGSGTTAHAVAALNAEDGGNRRFVLVECEDYVDKVTAERIRRVTKGVPTAKDEKLKAGYGGSFSYFKLGEALEKQAILDGGHLPSFETLAGYVFFTATGEQFEADKIEAKSGFIGESRNYDVFLLYEDDVEALKDLALTLDVAKALPSHSGKPKLVFAPTKYLEEETLRRLRIVFHQLPFEIYQRMDAKRK